MTHFIRRAIKIELALASAARQSADFDLAVHHLERAHIVGQRYFFAHLNTHLLMLWIAVQRRQPGEMFGQLTRLVAVVPGYIFGWVPVGNPGSARVSPVKPMPIPADLQVYFAGYSMKRSMGWRAALLLVGLAIVAGVASYRHAAAVAVVEQAWTNRDVNRLGDFGSTKTLEIIPLVNWHATSGKLKTEAGVSYLVKTDRNTILFDVAWNALREDPSPLQHNMRELGIALSDVDTIFLSHAHRDHTGGEWVNANTFSLGNTQVDLQGKRIVAPVALTYPGATVARILHPTALADGVASSGPIARKLVMGPIAEQALVINVEGKGLVVVVGCGHQTVPKLVQLVADSFATPLHGVVGDLHYPVPHGRLSAGGLDLQKRFASGQGFFSPVTESDVDADAALLRLQGVGLVALGSHDTSDEALRRFALKFGRVFQRVSIGKPIKVGVE